MNDRDKAIIEKAAAGAKLSALAEEFGLSSTRIGRIIKQAKQVGKPKGSNSLSAYYSMIIHYEPIARWFKRNPGSRDLPDHLDEADDEIRAICEKNGWKYPGEGGAINVE